MTFSLVFHYRDQPSRKQQGVLAATIAGAARHGDRVVGEKGLDRIHEEADGAILFGIGGIAKMIFDGYRSAGLRTVLIDKGYTRNEYHRIAVNNFQPLAYMQQQRHSGDRLHRLGVEFSPYRAGGRGYILFDGASNKFARWKELGDYSEWGEAMVAKIAGVTDLPIIYRPRPTHNIDRPVDGAELSRRPLEEDLARAWVVVSYGGNIGWDAAAAGVPHFAIGDSIARPISETDWARIAIPRVPTDDERHQWAADVAYQQWTLAEIASGEAWAYVKEVR